MDHTDEFTCALDQRESTEGEREAARAAYQTNDIQIDDDALVSDIVDSENIWVQAWVYILKETT